MVKMINLMLYTFYNLKKLENKTKQERCNIYCQPLTLKNFLNIYIYIYCGSNIEMYIKVCKKKSIYVRERD